MASKSTDAENISFEYGSITGDLDQISIHNNLITLFPTDGTSRAVCIIPNELKQQALGAVGRYITVYGRLKYKNRDSDPYEMLAEEIEVHDDEAVQLGDLQGIAPDLLAGRSSEEIVWEIRNAWE